MRNLVRSQTAKRLKKLQAELEGVSRKRGASSGDADGIHDLRVSIRRLSQGLRVFQPWFQTANVPRVRRRLRKLMKRCAAVRNYDVALDVLHAAGWNERGLFAKLKTERGRARDELAGTLRNWRRRNRLRRWRGKLRAQQPATAARNSEGASRSKAENARRLLPRMIEELFRAGNRAARAGASHETMHQFRLKTKRMRYTLELFEPVYGAKTEHLMDWLKGLQEKLGAINDCAVTLQMIRRNGRAAAAVRRLAGEREAEFRTYWKRGSTPRERTKFKAVLAVAGEKK